MSEVTGQKRMSITEQLEAKERVISQHLDKLTAIEKRLNTSTLSSDLRKSLENQVNTIKEQLNSLENELKLLRKENRRSFIVTVALFILLILIYYTIRWSS